MSFKSHELFKCCFAFAIVWANLSFLTGHFSFWAKIRPFILNHIFRHFCLALEQQYFHQVWGKTHNIMHTIILCALALLDWKEPNGPAGYWKFNTPDALLACWAFSPVSIQVRVKGHLLCYATQKICFAWKEIRLPIQQSCHGRLKRLRGVWASACEHHSFLKAASSTHNHQLWCNCACLMAKWRWD